MTSFIPTILSNLNIEPYRKKGLYLLSLDLKKKNDNVDNSLIDNFNCAYFIGFDEFGSNNNDL